MAPRYGKLEKKVLDLFEVGSVFEYQNKKFKVLLSDKPRSSAGEPKTDAFIKAQEVNNENNIITLKISCKLKKENEFQENKIKAERAQEIWGNDWKEVIRNAAISNDENFRQTEVYFPEGSSRTKETMFTNGWKVEITNKYRTLSYPLEFSEQEVRDIIYKGLTLDRSKKDSKVSGQVIKDSGVAEYILVSTPEELHKPEDVLKNMQLIDDYHIVPHYIVFTANNFRVLKNKSDGNRPLAVQVFWEVDKTDDTKMEYSINYSNPLDPNYSGKKIAEKTLNEISKLNPNTKKDFI